MNAASDYITYVLMKEKKEWLASEIPNELIGMHQASYKEYLDGLDVDVQQ